MKKEQTLGEFRTGTSSNPSYKDIVGKLRSKSAVLIDLIDSINHQPSKDYSDGTRGNGHLTTKATYERNALKEIAMRKVEEATMWAIKAATKE